MLTVLLLVSVLGALPRECEGVPLSISTSVGYRRGDHAREISDLDEKYGWVLLLYRESRNEIASVPSGQKPAGPPDDRLLRVDRCQRALWPAFYNDAGIQYLAKNLRVETDTTNMLAVLEVLSASSHPSAIPVFEEFAKYQKKIVARRAKAYLKRAERNRSPR